MHYVIVENTEYDEREVWKERGYQWDPTAQRWSRAFTTLERARGEADELEDIIQNTLDLEAPEISEEIEVDDRVDIFVRLGRLPFMMRHALDKDD